MNYLFNISPGPNFNFYIPLFILAGILILGGLVFSFYYDKKKKEDVVFKRMFRKLGTHSVLLGLLMIFLAAVRYENIPYFSMRFLLFLSLLLIAFVGYKYVRKYKVEYPKEVENVQNRPVKKDEKRYVAAKSK